MAPGALRVLLIGKGGREHALAWKLSQSPSVEHVFVCPGNGGTARGLDKVSNVQVPHPDDYASLVALAKELSIGLVVVGPDEDVVAGIEGFFRRGNTTPFPLSSGVQVVSITASSPSDSPPTENIPCFAPTKEAAELEGSKAFAKDFMRRHGIPTAKYQTFDDVAVAKDYVRRVNYPVVIKASGLAAGKGVVLPKTKDEACEALDDMMVREQFGGAGSSVVVEELLAGEARRRQARDCGRTRPVRGGTRRQLGGMRGGRIRGRQSHEPPCTRVWAHGMRYTPNVRASDAARHWLDFYAFTHAGEDARQSQFDEHTGLEPIAPGRFLFPGQVRAPMALQQRERVMPAVQLKIHNLCRAASPMLSE
ncbi:hypothetical protein Purlil1_11013 [Purpureocillium lilacinum]|uniref:ATP-grasp domain-containing protein n=1 Tax=Purpureocillium lilacinum TaxID=33203 RepID=A0ABR0BKW5_PURLI|nr:hypothetical protein Purlil1_11013 [Purpureocillium lilacinum]